MRHGKYQRRWCLDRDVVVFGLRFLIGCDPLFASTITVKKDGGRCEQDYGGHDDADDMWGGERGLCWPGVIAFSTTTFVLGLLLLMLGGCWGREALACAVVAESFQALMSRGARWAAGVFRNTAAFFTKCGFVTVAEISIHRACRVAWGPADPCSCWCVVEFCSR